jgi:hypothetical protein
MVGLNVIVGAAVGDVVGDDVGSDDSAFTVAVVSTIAPQSARNVCILAVASVFRIFGGLLLGIS